VGFLFPHDCQRISPLDCPDCQNGAVEDPYLYGDRYGYSSYDDYDDGYYYMGPAYVAGEFAGPPDSQDSNWDAPDTTSMEFTEADGADLVQTDDNGGFENDMTGS
jgi:hypothetical protein